MKLAGVLIYTAPDRHPAMRGFYAEMLGLPVRSDRDGFVNFEWEGLRLTVAVHSDLSGAATDPKRLMVNLAVDDIHAEYERLREVGIPFLRPPEQESWGGWVATFTDPDGNVVQFLELP